MLGKKISSSGKGDINNKDVLLPNKISSFSQTKEEKVGGRKIQQPQVGPIRTNL